MDERNVRQKRAAWQKLFICFSLLFVYHCISQKKNITVPLGKFSLVSITLCIPPGRCSSIPSGNTQLCKIDLKFVFKQFCICIWTILSMPSQTRWGYAAVQNCATFQNWHLWVTCKGKSSLIWNIPLCKNLTWQKCVQDSIQSEVSIEIGGYASKKLPTLQGIHINRSSTQLTQLASLLPHKHKSQIHNMLIIVKEQIACFKLTALHNGPAVN